MTLRQVIARRLVFDRGPHALPVVEDLLSCGHVVRDSGIRSYSRLCRDCTRGKDNRGPLPIGRRELARIRAEVSRWIAALGRDDRARKTTRKENRR